MNNSKLYFDGGVTVQATTLSVSKSGSLAVCKIQQVLLLPTGSGSGSIVSSGGKRVGHDSVRDRMILGVTLILILVTVLAWIWR
jgi:hypothetical protein